MFSRCNVWATQLVSPQSVEINHWGPASVPPTRPLSAGSTALAPPQTEQRLRCLHKTLELALKQLVQKLIDGLEYILGHEFSSLEFVIDLAANSREKRESAEGLRDWVIWGKLISW